MSLLRVGIAVAVALLAAPSRAETPFEVALTVKDQQSTVALDGAARGRLRMTLELKATECAVLDEAHPPRGELRLTIDVAPRRWNRVDVRAKGLRPKAFGECLRRALAKAPLPEVAASWRWKGTLRFDEHPSMEVDVSALDGAIERLLVENTVRAALEQPARCMDAVFAPAQKMSYVMRAKLAADATGALTTVTVDQSTVVPEDVLACVRNQLKTAAFPPGAPIGAELRISLLRTLDESELGDDDVPMAIIGAGDDD